MHAHYYLPLIVGAIALADVMSTAISRAHTSHKALALDMGISEPYLSHAISGDKALGLGKLLKCEPRFLRELGAALIAAAGGEAPLTRAALRHELVHAVRLLAGRPVMASHTRRIA